MNPVQRIAARLCGATPTAPEREVERKLRELAKTLGMRLGRVPRSGTYSAWDGRTLRIISKREREHVFDETWAEDLSHEISHCIVADKWRRSVLDWGLGPSPILYRSKLEQPPLVSLTEKIREECRTCALQFCILQSFGGLRHEEVSELVNFGHSAEDMEPEIGWLLSKRLITPTGKLTAKALKRGVL